jgi:hypothetical protein
MRNYWGRRMLELGLKALHEAAAVEEEDADARGDKPSMPFLRHKRCACNAKKTSRCGVKKKLSVKTN